MSEDTTPAPINAKRVFVIREPYGERMSLPIGFDPHEDMCHQAHKDECDVNRIMSQYLKTGIMPEGQRIPSFEDCTSAEDYHTALNMIMDAENLFDSFPATIRERFDNDPAKYLEAIDEAQNDPAVKSELVELGILRAPAPTASPSQSPSSPETAQPAPAGASDSAPVVP